MISLTNTTINVRLRSEQLIYQIPQNYQAFLLTGNALAFIDNYWFLFNYSGYFVIFVLVVTNNTKQ
jgi:hypothetical protein